MVRIGDDAKKVLESTIGMSLSKVFELNVYDEPVVVKAKTGKKLCFSRSNNSNLIGRGNPLLARKKFTTIEEINKKIDSLKQ